MPVLHGPAPDPLDPLEPPGGRPVDSSAQAASLRYAVSRAGADRLIDVTEDGSHLDLRLAPAAPLSAQAMGVFAPATRWRIDSSMARRGTRPLPLLPGRDYTHH